MKRDRKCHSCGKLCYGYNCNEHRGKSPTIKIGAKTGVSRQRREQKKHLVGK